MSTLSKSAIRRFQNLILPAAVLILSTLCILSVVLNPGQPMVQSSTGLPTPVRLTGAYSWDNETWYPLQDDTELPASGNQLYLRGRFDRDIPADTRFNYYHDHIVVEITVNGTPRLESDTVDWVTDGNRMLPLMCGKYWTYVYSHGISADDIVEIQLYDLHRHGNRNAYREFLDSLCISVNDSSVIQNMLQPHRTPYQLAGVFAVTVGLLVLGAAIIALTLRLPLGRILLIPGLFCLSGGGFILLDVISPSYWSGTVAYITYGRQLCMMMSVYLLGLCIRNFLTGPAKRLADRVMALSALVDIGCTAACLSGILIFDTEFYWLISQWIVTPMLLVCCLWQLCRRRGYPLFTATSSVLLAALLLDLCGVGRSIYSSGTCTKTAFLAMLLLYLIRAAKFAVVNAHAAVRAKLLERQLEDSRISIMLSQLQPHFLYNVLNSVYYLCRHDPEAARDMIDKFSDYLRNNLASLEQTELIPFREEYQHVQTYLSLEELRFGASLNVVYDIGTEDFLLPPLSVQPLVENAVRHGVTKKEGGGTVRLTTRETADSFVVTVSDTGRGFDPDHYMDDGKIHVGIRNVRKRLEYMSGGTLTIVSAPGEGTSAIITLPKKKD